MGGRASIIMVLGFAAIFAMIQYRLSQVGSEAIDNMISYHEEMATHGIAVAGANLGLSLIYQNQKLRGVLADNQPYYEGSFTVRFDSLRPDTFLLKSISYYSGERDTVAIYLGGKTKQTFSIFAYMTLVEGNIWWISGDTVWGRLHSNDKIQVSGSPVFMEKVTAVGGFSPAPGQGSNNAIFKDGFETGVAPVDFPANLGDLKNAAMSAGYYTTDELWIKLKPGTAANNDGWAFVYTDSKMDTEPGKEYDYLKDSVNINDPSFNGVLYSNNKIHLQGTLDGKLSVASSDQMYLDDNVILERNPKVGPSDDLLGLVSEKDVYVTENATNNSDIEIHATIFTRSGSFTAENYKTRPVSGIIKLVGGLVQSQRGPVGTFSGGKIKSGFLKRYYYDDRLADPLFRPPSFPGFWAKTMRIVSWWE